MWLFGAELMLILGSACDVGMLGGWRRMLEAPMVSLWSQLAKNGGRIGAFFCWQ